MTTSWVTRNIPTSSWAGRSIPSSIWDDERQYHFLLQETLSFLLLETGDKIRLNQFGPQDITWTARTTP